MRSCEATPRRARSHHSASERSRQVEGNGECRAAADTMREAVAASAPASCAKAARDPSQPCRMRRAARNPRRRSSRVISGIKTKAPRKSPLAGRGRALNRRSRAHIGGLRRNQAVVDQVLQKFGQVGAENVERNVVLLAELEEGGV